MRTGDFERVALPSLELGRRAGGILVVDEIGEGNEAGAGAEGGGEGAARLWHHFQR